MTLMRQTVVCAHMRPAVLLIRCPRLGVNPRLILARSELYGACWIFMAWSPARIGVELYGDDVDAPSDGVRQFFDVVAVAGHNRFVAAQCTFDDIGVDHVSGHRAGEKLPCSPGTGLVERVDRTAVDQSR